MAFLSELDVINDQLATMGEAPLNSIEEDHPFMAAGLRLLRTASWREQGKGWWFNREIVTLTPEPSTGDVYVPGDTIQIDPTNIYVPYVQRGRRLYDPTKGTYVFTAPVRCGLIRHVPFEDLPPSAAAYIGTSAVLAFQKNYDGDSKRTGELNGELKDAFKTLNSEHIRAMGSNMLTKGSAAAKMVRLGVSPVLGPLVNG